MQIGHMGGRATREGGYPPLVSVWRVLGVPTGVGPKKVAQAQVNDPNRRFRATIRPRQTVDDPRLACVWTL
jgi:hypothetical protein